jgi:predicted O-methyltransferase YrrM
MNNNLLLDVAKIGEFQLLTERFKHVEGWLNPVEGYLLYRLARDAEGHGAIVEIGSWMGLSTAWLAAGSKAAGREHVHAVDVFDGGPMLKELAVIRDEGTTYHRFTQNLEGLGLFDHVEPIVAESSTAARQWTKGPIRLLFIDGDHGYAAVKQDFDLWSRHVIAGGIVVFDDAGDEYPGVTQLFNEVVSDSQHWQQLLRVGKTQSIRKTA